MGGWAGFGNVPPWCALLCICANLLYIWVVLLLGWGRCSRRRKCAAEPFPKRATRCDTLGGRAQEWRGTGTARTLLDCRHPQQAQAPCRCAGAHVQRPWHNITTRSIDISFAHSIIDQGPLFVCPEARKPRTCRSCTPRCLASLRRPTPTPTPS